ncbi:MAG: DsbA family protein [Elusimicrobiales bacterium]
MISKEKARLAALAVAVIFAATAGVLLARQFNLGPARPAPGFRTFGPPDAQVRITEYSDFACGACRAAADAAENMLRVYGPDVRLELKHYPLVNIHPWSLDAAAYADCAGEQGKFKQYSARLFGSQEKWGDAKEKPEEFEAITRELALDWPAMQACAAAPAARNRVKLDMAEAEMRGVNATPTFFINGKRAVGPAQFAEAMRKFDGIIAARRRPPAGNCPEK